MKNNKEDSAALATHARDITEKLFDALQSLDGLDSMRSNIDDFVKYVIILALSARLDMFCPQSLRSDQSVLEGAGGEEGLSASSEEAERRRRD
jgi:hypothetical protein